MTDAKILIVEDQRIIAEHLKGILEDLSFSRIRFANDKSSAFQAIESFEPDLILLDIRMKEDLDGIEIARKIHDEWQIPFIFVTAQSDTEILRNALQCKPEAYITKPFKETDILAAVSIALKNTREDSFISIKEGYKEVKVYLNSILYVESDKNYIDIYCRSNKYTLRNSLEWFLQQVNSPRFTRVHRSFIVNKEMVTKSSRNTLFISDREIPISRKYAAEAKSILRH
ncbi:response regulator [Flavobacterium sp.]|uniref:LytR/AlgR family response regulator transcription factor n=1 Tax=Flavobacterium sp. TaxID=239 RepID=UPI00261A699B|nr:response regulator [Flavobacterium sp.]